MDVLKQKLSNAAMELKISVFCAIITGLSYGYKIIEPDIGAIVMRIAISTLIMSLMFFFYKLIFGSVKSIFVIIMFLSFYVGMISYALREILVMKGAITVVFLCVAFQAFKLIFWKKNKNEPLKEEVVIKED